MSLEPCWGSPKWDLPAMDVLKSNTRKVLRYRGHYINYTNIGFGSKKVLILNDLPLKSCIVWVGVIY